MSSREDTPEPGTSAASTSRAAPAAPRDGGRESPVCPECRDVGTACSSSCRHCFCQLCLWDWSLGEAVCPRCRRPARHPYPQHVALYHEVQERVYEGKRRQPRSCFGRLGRGRPWERRRRRSVRWPRDGRWRGSDSPRRRWWRHGRPWEDARGEGQAARFERGVPASSRGSRSRRRSRRSWGHRRRSRGRERSHSRGRSSRRDQDTQAGSHARQRSWNAGDRHAPGPQHDGPSGRSETHRWEDWDSSRHQHATRRRTRSRSHRRGRDTRTSSQGTVPRDHSRRQRRWRSWNADQGRAPRSQWDIPGSSRRSRRRHRNQSRARRRGT